MNDPAVVSARGNRGHETHSQDPRPEESAEPCITRLGVFASQVTTLANWRCLAVRSFCAKLKPNADRLGPRPCPLSFAPNEIKKRDLILSRTLAIGDFGSRKSRHRAMIARASSERTSRLAEVKSAIVNGKGGGHVEEFPCTFPENIGRLSRVNPSRG